MLDLEEQCCVFACTSSPTLYSNGGFSKENASGSKTLSQQDIRPLSDHQDATIHRLVKNLPPKSVYMFGTSTRKLNTD